MKGNRQQPMCGFSAKVVGMLDELKQHRLPSVPLAFNWARDKPQDDNFRFELRLGVFHYMPASMGDSEDDSDTE